MQEKFAGYIMLTYFIGTFGALVPHRVTVMKPYNAVKVNWENVTRSPQPGENLCIVQ